MQRHIFTREKTPVPRHAVCSAQCRAPIHRTSRRCTNTCTSWGKAGSAPQKWLQQVRRTRCETTQQAREEQTMLLGCTLLSTVGDGTVAPGSRGAAEDPLCQGYHRLALKPAEVRGSISTDFSEPCPLLGWAPSSRAEPGKASWTPSGWCCEKAVWWHRSVYENQSCDCL